MGFTSLVPFNMSGIYYTRRLLRNFYFHNIVDFLQKPGSLHGACSEQDPKQQTQGPLPFYRAWIKHLLFLILLKLLFRPLLVSSSVRNVHLHHCLLSKAFNIVLIKLFAHNNPATSPLYIGIIKEK
jgi:hypothetical protein